MTKKQTKQIDTAHYAFLALGAATLVVVTMAICSRIYPARIGYRDGYTTKKIASGTNGTLYADIVTRYETVTYTTMFGQKVTRDIAGSEFEKKQTLTLRANIGSNVVAVLPVNDAEIWTSGVQINGVEYKKAEIISTEVR